MSQSNSLMNDNIAMLGKLLGETIKGALGEGTYERVETIRQLSKASHNGDTKAHDKLVETLQNLPDKDFLPVAQAFNQFLNLTNVAEQLGVSYRHLLRTLKSLCEAGLLEKRSVGYWILDEQELHEKAADKSGFRMRSIV